MEKISLKEFFASEPQEQNASISPLEKLKKQYKSLTILDQKDVLIQTIKILNKKNIAKKIQVHLPKEKDIRALTKTEDVEKYIDRCFEMWIPRAIDYDVENASKDNFERVKMLLHARCVKEKIMKNKEPYFIP